MTTSLDQTPDQAIEDSADRRRRRPWGRLFLTLALLLLVALAVAWLQRRTIAREFVDRELSRRGVRAQYTIEQLSPWRQRLTGVVIGDPRAPDLTADWVELGTTLSPWGARVLALRAGQVRLTGRVVGGRLALGDIDKLMPPPSGKPFALPHIEIDVADARLALDSPAGRAELAFAGKGLLDDGFAGTARVTAPRLDVSGCSAAGISGAFDLRIRDARPSIAGPLAASRLDCAGVRAETPRIGVQADLGAALDSWKGAADLALPRLEMAMRRVSDVQGRITFDGTTAATRGAITLRSGRFAAVEASGAGLDLAGGYRQQGGSVEYRGKVTVRGAALPEAQRVAIRNQAQAARGTPLAPIAARLAQSVAAAAAGFDANADVTVAASSSGFRYALPRLQVDAASGARLSFDRGGGVSGDGASAAPRIDGTLALRGGGMPEAVLRLSQRQGEARLRGTGFVQPYAANGASLALANIAFSFGQGRGELRTAATLSGPLGAGRVEQLALPLDARWRGDSVTVNPGCATVRFDRVAIAGAVLAQGSLNACPIGGAMVGISSRGVAGGIRLTRPQLVGRVGSSPLTVRADDARLLLGASRFSLGGVQVRLGAETATRLDIASLGGRFGSEIAGDFAGLGGQIGAVPLVISGAAGSWKTTAEGLALAGALTVSDAAPEPRFYPLASDDARLALSGNAVSATAGLKAPTAGVAVARIDIRHDLSTGRGTAAIDVPGIAFAENGFQPSVLTPLTFGVIADVSGSVDGKGRIDWSPEGVTSTGRFGTKSVDLAAAFGPVRGLATTLDFTDLLGMRTAPGQVAVVAEINPGVPVRDGTVRFQLLEPTRVAVEGGRWPFAGGELVLEPTVLDFSERQARRMTFQVTGVDAALFLKEMEFDNLDATGTFDGTLPMIFDAQGGRIEGGVLRARAGGSLAYVGELSQRDLGVWGNMAFQALKALEYKSLTIDMNGPLAGDMVTEIRFAGVSQGKGTKSNFLLRRLAKLPFVFNVRIAAPFKQLLDSVQSWYDPNRLIERNLPALLQEQEVQGAAAPVQPPESQKLR